LEVDPVLPEPVLDPMPLEPLVLPAPDGLLLLGEALEPLEDDEPLDDEPCSRRQRSFSVPVRLSHWVLPPMAGEVVEDELPLALGEVLDEPLDPVLPLALGVLPAPCDDESAAMPAVEIASRAASVAAESAFNIVALLGGG
jgi:hypothetical protein